MKRVLWLAIMLPMTLMIGCTSPKTWFGASPPIRQSPVVTDAAITTQVKTALARDADLATTRIAVDTTAGIVTLKGEIKSMMLRKKVDAIVNGVTGVREIDNRLVITG